MIIKGKYVSKFGFAYNIIYYNLWKVNCIKIISTLLEERAGTPLKERNKRNMHGLIFF